MKNWLPDRQSFRFPRGEWFPTAGTVAAVALVVVGFGLPSLATKIHKRFTTSAPAVKPTNSFEPALPGYRFQFPRDDGSHPSYMTEWWYYTGHLRSATGARFGYQLTFFRNALTPRIQRTSRWAVRDVILGHLALTDESGRQFYFTDRIARGSADLAGATSEVSRATSFEPHIWLYDWSLKFTQQSDGQQILRAFGQSEELEKMPFGLALRQKPLKIAAIHGLNGVSQKSAGRGHASHYYSYTRLATSGEITLGSRRYRVSGISWFDHEFGSNQLEPNQAGWDWFSLQLNDGRELMLYQIRLKNGRLEPYSSGTLIEKNGTTRHLRLQDFRIEVLDTWHSKRSNANYPARWRLSLPGENITLLVEPTLADQELQTRRSTNITYWEGSVTLNGTQNGRALRGMGYVELTGYAAQFNGSF